MISKWIAAPVLAVALWAGPQASEAQAQHGVRVQVGRFGLSIGGGHYGYYPSYSHGYHRHYGHYGHGYHSYHPGYYGHRSHHGHHGYYHDTTHLDYHPPQIVPHGNHYDYVPGHYDLHRSGHWHH